jgi:hypothetical protein
MMAKLTSKTKNQWKKQSEEVATHGGDVCSAIYLKNKN